MIYFDEIICQFEISGRLVNAEIYGQGHINDTYKVTLQDGADTVYYIIQKINHNVFKDIAGLMNNIVSVTEYIKQKIIEEGGNADRVLRVIPTREGRYFYYDGNGGYYRCYNYIYNTVCIETTPTVKQFYIAGTGFGKFQKYLDGYPAETLSEPIPDFHNTKDRLKKFIRAVEEDRHNRKKDVLKEIEFFSERAHYAGKVLDLMDKGLIPCRVTHNDTKINNMLIDANEDKAVTAIDLDTVMPGSILYDFGDSIRAGTNLGAEDDKNLDNVNFSLDHFEAFSKGFIREVKNILTEAEIENMAFGAILMTYECGMRFLTDHLNGDVYFKIHRENHNLDRARTQIKLVREMESRIDLMNEIVRNYAR